MFLKDHILTVHTLCYICINGIFLISFLLFNCLSFTWELIDYMIINFWAIYLFTKSPHLDASFPSLVFILLVPFASFGSTEQRHCNLICSITRLTLGSFKTPLKQIGLFQKKWGVEDILFWKAPLGSLDLSLYPRKFQRKKVFTPGNSANLCDTPWRFQSQKPRPMEIPH